MTSRRPIYLDHHATTPVDPRVLEAMLPYYREEYGNPASVSHAYGWTAAAAVDDARERIAGLLGARTSSIVFTSGATEANNLAIQGVARARRSRRDHLVSVATEHPAVLDVCRALADEGFDFSLVPVASDGLTEVPEIAAALTHRTALVSVMTANNEIGVLQPVREIAAVCAERDVVFHTDAAQAAGKIRLAVDELGVDLLSISAHKFYGPKGIGALYVRPRTRLVPLVHGGGHERGLRSGTLPVALIVGMARALEIACEQIEAEAVRLLALRERLFAQLARDLEHVRLNGHPSRRLPGNLNVSFRGVDGDRLLLALTDVAVSSGSACSTAKPEPSHVLLALGLSKTEAGSSIRIGLGRGTTQEQVDRAAARIVEEVRAQWSETARRGIAREQGAEESC
jgi:cysteine desulfurase